jgi:hypothetical protein
MNIAAKTVISYQKGRRKQAVSAKNPERNPWNISFGEREGGDLHLNVNVNDN